MIVLSLLVGYPKWKVRCSVAENFPWQRYQGLSPVGLRTIQEGGKVNNGAVHNRGCQLHLDLHIDTNNYAPNEYRGVVNSSGLTFYKGSTQEIMIVGITGSKS